MDFHHKIAYRRPQTQFCVAGRAECTWRDWEKQKTACKGKRVFNVTRREKAPPSDVRSEKCGGAYVFKRFTNWQFEALYAQPAIDSAERVHNFLRRWLDYLTATYCHWAAFQAFNIQWLRDNTCSQSQGRLGAIIISLLRMLSSVGLTNVAQRSLSSANKLQHNNYALYIFPSKRQH